MGESRAATCHIVEQAVRKRWTVVDRANHCGCMPASGPILNHNGQQTDATLHRAQHGGPRTIVIK
jgi:hypothetical protein